MKRFLSSLLTLIMVIGIFTSVPITVNAISADDLIFELNEEGAGYVVTGCSSDFSGQMVIPDTYNALPVVSIQSSAFSGNQNITSVIIPGSVKDIGGWAFENCTSLVSVIIDEGVMRIGYSAFGNCFNLSVIEIPDSVSCIGPFVFSLTAYYNNSVNWENDVLYINNHLIEAKTSIGESYNIKEGTKCIAERAFFDCTNLSSVTIPDSVIGIGENAFHGTACYDNPDNWENDVLYINNHLIEAKTSISGDYVIKEGTKCIADRAFSLCENLTSVIIPDSITRLGNHTFSACRGFTSFVIPDSVESIGNGTFDYCSNLQSIVIPCSVTSMGENVFEYCSVLSSIFYAGTEEEWLNINIVGHNSYYLSRAIVHYQADDHTESEWIIDQPATCTTSGSKHKVCTVCEIELETEVIPATGHTLSNWIIDQHESCTGTGLRYKYCLVCYKTVETEVTPATGHTLSDWIIVDNATCTETGSRCKQCLVCYETVETEEIPTTGHTSFDWIIDKNATYTEEGLKHKECDVCGTSFETVNIPVLSNNYFDVFDSDVFTLWWMLGFNENANIQEFSPSAIKFFTLNKINIDDYYVGDKEFVYDWGTYSVRSFSIPASVFEGEALKHFNITDIEALREDTYQDPVYNAETDTYDMLE